MTHEQFSRACKSLTERLDSIAERTKNLAFMGRADSNNPDFIDLMKMHKDTVDAINQLIDVYEEQLSKREI